MGSQRKPFLEFLEQSIVLFDGGIGTELYRRGVFVNRCFDELSLSSPELVRQVHMAYADVGADVLETNTFGANRVKLTKYGFGEQTAAINFESARIAREAAGDSLYVAGAVGPLGIRIEPWGPTSITEAEEFFREQAEALVRGGANLFVLETFSDLNEIAAAIRAARSVSDVPIIASMTIEDDGNSLEGTAPEVFAAKLDAWGADVVGVNCSVGPAAMLMAVERMAEATRRKISAMPNAGRPRNIDGRNLYLCSPEYVASYARRFIQAGARVVGGCCGTTPDHIRAIRRAIRTMQPAVRRTVITVPSPGPGRAVEEVRRADKSGLARALVAGRFVVCVEVLPPKGCDASEVLEGVRYVSEQEVDAILIPERPSASARMTPQALAQLLMKQVGIESIVEYGCRERNLPGMQSDLLGAWVLGIRNLLLITGDPAPAGQYPGANGVFEVDAIGLTNMVHRLNRAIDIGGNAIGAPTAFHIGVRAKPGASDLDREISRFEWKVDAGAEYAVTQPVFDVRLLEQFSRRIAHVRVPLIASIVPLASFRDAEFLNNEIPGVVVPEGVLERMRRAESEGHPQQEGIAIARELLGSLRGLVEGALVSVPHGRYASAIEVLDGLVERRAAAPPRALES